MEDKKCNCNISEDTVRTTKRSEEEKESLIKRLNIIEGQVRGVKQMILDDRYCDDVLTQMLAINKALESLENIILERHLNTCIKKTLPRVPEKRCAGLFAQRFIAFPDGTVGYT